MNRADRDEHWTDQPFSAFDTETTGVDPGTDQLVSAALVTIHGRGVATLSWLAAIDVPDEAAAVHGITTAHARRHGQPPAKVLEQVVDALAAAFHAGPVVIYNAPYDLTLLANDATRNGLTMCPIGTVVDPLVLDRHYDKRRQGSRRLADVAAMYRVELDDRDAHGAGSDAITAARLAYKLVRRSQFLRAMSPPELHRWQAQRYVEQQHSFASYLRDVIAEKLLGQADEADGDARQAKLDERAAVLTRADNVDATAHGWPIAGANGVES